MDTMEVEQLIGWDSLLHEEEKMVRKSVVTLRSSEARNASVSASRTALSGLG